MRLKAAVIGLGKQSVDDHIPALMESNLYELKAVCDVDSERVNSIATQYDIGGFTKLDELLSVHTLDVVIVAVPHSHYLGIITQAAKQGIHIIKEKPFATSV